MAISHSATVRNTFAAAVLTAINLGSGAGRIKLKSGASTVLANLACSDPAGTVTGAVLTFAAIASDTNAVAGTAATFDVTDSDGTVVFSGSVSTSGADLNLSSVSIGNGDTVSISSATYTACA